VRSNYAGGANRYQGATLDRVDVSDLADTMDRVLSADQQSRSAEVENLTRIYQSGQYSVDDESLTNAIMADMDADRVQTGL
jgi:anti-sigma28 factor (negative regulator of flagellin synthesis)